MLPKRKAFSYRMVWLIVLLLGYGITVTRSITVTAVSVEVGCADADAATNPYVDPNMLTKSGFRTEEGLQNAGRFERVLLTRHHPRIADWDPIVTTENTWRSSSLSISIEVSNETVMEGTSFTLNVFIENNGDSEAEEVTVTIILPSHLISTTTQQSLGTIFACGMGGTCSSSAAFSILANEAGTYSITITVSTKNAARVSESVTITVLPFQTPVSEIYTIPGFFVIIIVLLPFAFICVSRGRKANSSRIEPSN